MHTRKHLARGEARKKKRKEKKVSDPAEIRARPFLYQLSDKDIIRLVEWSGELSAKSMHLQEL